MRGGSGKIMMGIVIDRGIKLLIGKEPLQNGRTNKKKKEQAGAELCQAQQRLGLDIEAYWHKCVFYTWPEAEDGWF